ncbi:MULTISPECIES: MspI family type II restriction endonuclease [Bacillaceae]|uniref:MspI family type II restriction endonuclease n=1 Tax=Evansella alkalicola TaxID=745819 RepID=A0ABS6JZ01_9BACI|nr:MULTISPECIES: MspI family type II restriction endonuclease [Bacillaceae]MBU9723815.1 MspI family type II restriction endonuclease [Bacillus alkalicola]
MNYDNSKKSLHGKAGKEELENLLKGFEENQFVKDIVKDYSVGYGSHDNNQFKTHFLVQFLDNEQWIITSTTSVRSDRTKGNQWEAYNIKQLNKNVTRAILTYPDGINEKEELNAKSYNRKIQENNIYSEITDVISISDLFDEIEQKVLQSKSPNSKRALEGNSFEKRLVVILNNKGNLKKWNSQNSIEVGLQFPIFSMILEAFGMKNDISINKISATDKISKLPSGGLPKTDVLIKFYFENKPTQTYTVSCKRTRNNKVTIHEYSVDSFIKALCLEDKRLIESLRSLQKVGGPTALKNNYPPDYDYLNNNLINYINQLSKWVYGGIGGEGNPNEHWAYYIVSYNNELKEVSIYTIDDYIKQAKNIAGQFNTPFTWTYASGQKGKSLQLKGPVI